MYNEDLRITFLGTGTSQGVPVIACNCNICTSNDSRDKRLRSSILVESKRSKLVIDTGPDFRQQMLESKCNRLDAVVFTHEHKDHVAGLDDIRAFNFAQRQAMDVYADPRVQQHLKGEFPYIFSGVDYPGIPKLNLIDINKNEKFRVGDIELEPIEVLHYKLPVFAFRMGDFSYVTDANHIDESQKELLKGSKVLVLNALRIEKHISHFSLSEALELVEELQPEMCYLTHISHLLGTHTEVSKMLPDNVRLAYDFLSITMT